MTPPPRTLPCPACGAAATGRFCARCGAPVAAGSCAGCGTALEPGARFCSGCGRPATGAGTPAMAGTPRVRTGAWPLVGVLVGVAAVVTLVVARAGRGAPAPVIPTTTGGAAVAPDISNLSPREQFGRLADRIERAMSSGDTATVVQFFPMAEAAWTNLPATDRDPDARFHISLLRARIGHAAAALAQADTIAMADSTHLFVDYLRAIIHDFEGDTTAATAARRDFRTHYDTEIATQRPEYAAHQQMLQQFLATTPVLPSR